MRPRCTRATPGKIRQVIPWSPSGSGRWHSEPAFHRNLLAPWTHDTHMTERRYHPMHFHVQMHDGWPTGITSIRTPWWRGEIVSCPPGEGERASEQLTGSGWIIAVHEAGRKPFFTAMPHEGFGAFAAKAEELATSAGIDSAHTAAVRRFPPLDETAARECAEWLGALAHRNESRCSLNPPSPSLFTARELYGVAAALAQAGIRLPRPSLDDERPQAARFFITRPFGVQAEAIQSGQRGMTVLAGSTLSASTVPSLRPAAQKARDRLITAGTAEFCDGVYVLRENATFSSASQAAGVVTGLSENGWDAWRTQSGQRMGDAVGRIPHRSPRNPRRPL